MPQLTMSSVKPASSARLILFPLNLDTSAFLNFASLIALLKILSVAPPFVLRSSEEHSLNSIILMVYIRSELSNFWPRLKLKKRVFPKRLK